MTKYSSVDRLADFQFHDSQWHLLAMDEQKLTVEAAELNLRQSAPQNPADCDQEIARAEITFAGFVPLSYSPGSAWEKDAAGEWRQVTTDVEYTGADARAYLAEQLRKSANIFSLEADNNGIYKITACGAEPYFEARFRFESVRIEWDALRGPAWYVRHKWY